MNERQSKIFHYIESHGSVRISELQALSTGYTPMTLWRDLEKLEALGYIHRFRGGASIAHAQEREGEQPFYSRLKKNVTEKEAISQIAVDLLTPNHALYLDGGSTTYSLARHLPDGHYTIITSGANIAVELSQRNGFNVNLLGGQVLGATLACSGPQAEDMLENINIDIAILATSGFSLENGFACGCLSEARLKRHVISKAASCSIMLMDLDKIGKVHPFTFAFLRDIDIMITNDNPPPVILQKMEREHVKLFSPSDGYTSKERHVWFEEFLASKR